MALAGRGTVCDITGALVLFVPVCGAGAFAELYPFLHISVFPPCSATAARVTPLTTLKLHLLTSPEDVREATLHGRPFFSPSAWDRCFVDLSVDWPADSFVFGIPTLPSGLTGAALHLEEEEIDFSPVNSWLLQGGWECLPKSGLELDFFWSWVLITAFAFWEKVALSWTGLFRVTLWNVFPWAPEELLESDDEVLDRILLVTEILVLAVVPATVAEVWVKFDFVFLGWITAGTSPVFVLTMGPRLILKLTVFIEHDQVAFELLLNLLLDFATVVQVALEEALTEDCIPGFGCFLRWLAACKLDLEDTLYLFVSPRFWSSFSSAWPLDADERLEFCWAFRMLPFTITLLATPDAFLAGCWLDWGAKVWTFLASHKLSTGAFFSFPLTTCKNKNWN